MPRPRSVIRCLAFVLIAACSRAGSAGPQSTGEAGPAVTYVPGRSYLGAHDYVEYIAGNAPVIFTAPHGGDLLPASISDRTPDRCGGSATTTTDLNTVDLVRAMQARYFARFGQYPHVIIAHIARRKLDANRTAPEATCNNAEAEAAFREWHAFIDVAKRSVLQSYGKGWYMDMHGHAHPTQRLELGYLIAASDLQLSDRALNADRDITDASSIASIVKASSLPLSALLRGPDESRHAVREQRLPVASERAGSASERRPVFRCRRQHATQRLWSGSTVVWRLEGRPNLRRPDRGQLHRRPRQRSEPEQVRRCHFGRARAVSVDAVGPSTPPLRAKPAPMASR